jgi:hypothetical protein
MPSFAYKVRFIIAIVFAAALLLLCGCNKTPADNPLLQQFFVTNVFNRGFIVQFASDSNVDITSFYTKDTFILKSDTSHYAGALTASKNGTVYTGNWSSNSDYSKLNIDITTPAIPAEFNFLNRAWRFTKKEIPVMQLAPWGSDDPKVLYMQQL